MESMFSVVSRLITPEVFTVFGALFTAWIGWKATCKSLGLVKGFAQKFSFLGITAAMLLVAGLSTCTYGVGEVATRFWYGDTKAPVTEMPKETQVVFNSDQLLDLCRNAQNPEVAHSVLDYVRSQQTGEQVTMQQLTKVVLASNAENKEAVMEMLKYLQAKQRESKPVMQLASLNANDAISVYDPQGEPQVRRSRTALEEPVLKIEDESVIDDVAKTTKRIPGAFFFGLVGFGIACLVVSNHVIDRAKQQYR